MNGRPLRDEQRAGHGSAFPQIRLDAIGRLHADGLHGAVEAGVPFELAAGDGQPAAIVVPCKPGDLVYETLRRELG